MKSNYINKKTFLYRHFSKDGELLYVGISLYALNRLGQHAKHSSWFERISKVTIEHFENRAWALEAEKSAIINEKPYYNIHFKHHYAKESHISFRNYVAESLTASILKIDANYTVEKAAAFLNIKKHDFLKIIERKEIGTWELPPARKTSRHGTPIKSKIFITGFQMLEYLENLSSSNKKGKEA
jgi:hypothetical protein